MLFPILVEGHPDKIGHGFKGPNAGYGFLIFSLPEAKPSDKGKGVCLFHGDHFLCHKGIALEVLIKLLRNIRN
jgi:hypothetical protein